VRLRGEEDPLDAGGLDPAQATETRTGFGKVVGGGYASDVEVGAGCGLTLESVRGRVIGRRRRRVRERKSRRRRSC
jgi:hypothetical protein